jgi:hypothetical protein
MRAYARCLDAAEREVTTSTRRPEADPALHWSRLTQGWAEARMTTTDERCARCGDDLSVGSPLFNERHVVERRGVRSFLCGPCEAEQRAARRGRRGEMTEAEGHELENAANAFGSFAPGGH